VLSPIVWLDYYAVAAIPLAVVLPRLTWVWLAPLATWGLLSAGIGAGNGWGSARVLLVFAVVFGVIVHGERKAARGMAYRDRNVLNPQTRQRTDPEPSSG
jgi:hypothetical protein